MKDNLPKNELHLHLYNMFKEVIDILDKNNVRYVSIGGTAIGALREKGFIAWDDDIDIAIDYKDKDKIVEIFKNTKFDLISNHPKQRTVHFDKIIDTSLGILETDTLCLQDLYIDVFYLVPNHTISFIKKIKYTIYQFIWFFARRRTFKYLVRYENVGFAVGVKILNMLFFWKSTKKIMKYCDKVLYKPATKTLLKSDWIMYATDLKKAVVHYGDYDIFTRKAKFHELDINVPLNFEKDGFPHFGDIYIKPDQGSKHYYSHAIEIYDPNKHKEISCDLRVKVGK